MINKKKVGETVDPLPPGHVPDRRPLFGRWVRLEPVSLAAHGADLFRAASHDELWTYMGYGPFASQDAFDEWLKGKEASRDPWFYAFIRKDLKEACGMGAFMRADAANGVIEIGHIWMAPSLQRTREATDAIFLMMRHAFDDLGVRRLEWKCDALNQPSRRAAERFGFTFEGIFRQHMIVKGRNRDTAWFAMIDKDWPQARQAFQAWLRDENFDAAGKQIQPFRASKSG